MGFTLGQLLAVKTSFVQSELSARTVTTQLTQLIEVLGSLSSSPWSGFSGTVLLTVLESTPGSGTPTGTIFNGSTTLFFIRLLPLVTSHPGYNGGSGTIAYFTSLADLNNAFITQQGDLISSVQTLRVLNSSGVLIPKRSAVYYTGVNTSLGEPTVALASASVSATSIVLGMADEDIANGGSGSITVSGGYSYVDTLSPGFAINDPVYLSDTPGAFSITAGTVPVIFARVTQIGTATDPGSIELLGYGVGSGGGTPGATGIQGVTGLFGNTGVAVVGPAGVTGLAGPGGSQGATGVQGNQGVTGIIGSTGVQGLDGVTGVQGQTGVQGIQGVTGVIGGTGVQGETGIQGIQGATGVQGNQGVTGVTGDTGVQGVQGQTGVLGVQGDTGVQGIQGVTGVIGGTGVQGETGVQGIQGTTGVQGAQGVTGVIGDTGAQGIQGLTGVLGIQGVTGVIGDTGVQGITGIPGVASVTGLQGVTGLALGATGIQGDTGVLGLQGVTGLQGIQGDTGIQGVTGLTGDTGIQGVTGVGIASNGILASVTGINPIVLGNTGLALYSVPTGKNTIVTDIVMRLTSAGGITTTVTAAAGWQASTTNVFAPAQTVGVTAVNDMWTFAQTAKSVLGVSGNTLLMGLTGMAGGTGIFTIDVLGTELGY